MKHPWRYFIYIGIIGGEILLCTGIALHFLMPIPPYDLIIGIIGWMAFIAASIALAKGKME
jgi:hypothetical protein